MSIVTKKTIDIMLNGINAFEKSLNAPPGTVQILVLLKDELKYYKCLNGKLVEEVTFLKILGTKFDIFKFEKLATPFLKDSILKYAEKENLQPTEIFVYISKGNNNQLLVSAYTREKEIETITIEEHFESMGIK